MYSSENEYLVIIVVAGLFLIPTLIVALRNDMFKQLSFSSLIKTLNTAFLIQLSAGIILWFASYGIVKNTTDSIKISRFEDVVTGSFFTYSVLGVMIYFPLLIILNIANWIITKLKKIH
jgi:hypothetical protein